MRDSPVSPAATDTRPARSRPPIPPVATSNRPRQIADYYGKLIRDGHLGEHDQLPTSMQLTRLWDVSLSTATRGMALLRMEGLVYSTRQGVFVAPDAVWLSEP